MRIVRPALTRPLLRSASVDVEVAQGWDIQGHEDEAQGDEGPEFRFTYAVGQLVVAYVPSEGRYPTDGAQCRDEGSEGADEVGRGGCRAGGPECSASTAGQGPDQKRGRRDRRQRACGRR